LAHLPIIEQTPISDAWIIHDQTTKHHPLVESWPLTKSLIIFFWGQFKRFNHGYCKFVWSWVWLVIYLWSKVVCFVLFLMLRSLGPWCFMSHSWYLWKALGEKGLQWLGLRFWSYGVEAINYWTIFSMKTK
jgi:hypothetical protein